jgi:two-component system sensor histidine kinase ChiS
MSVFSEIETRKDFNIKNSFRYKQITEALYGQNLKLLNQNIELKELDDIRNKFISLARHQIGTPLTTVKGYASLLHEGIYGELPQKMEETLSIIERASDNLMHIIRDFMHVTKIEENEVQYVKEEFDLKQLIQNIVYEYKYNLNTNVLFSVDEHFYYIHADKEKLRTALSNILDNSIKYTKDGSISIVLDKKRQFYNIIVRDYGVRLLPHINSKLIYKFSIPGDIYEATIIGNDLGLYVAKKYIEGHRGNLQIKRNHENTSTEFSILLRY